MDSTSENTFQAGVVLDGKWVVLELIGRGGMGEVYRVHQLNLKRDAALKIISQRVFAETEGNEYEAEMCLERFRREVQVMAQIRHPNVLQIYDCGSIPAENGEGATPLEYITMEYVPGATLRSTMSPEGFYPEENLVRQWLSDYFLPLLDGVQAVHDLGIVHRDLKPENVLLDGSTPKIVDFGLARSGRLKPLTQSMDMRGTPPYMSPEHFLDLKRTDQRTDIYALGKILYEAIDGKISPDEVPFRQASLKNPTTSFFRKMDRIIQDATADEKSQRISSAKALKEAIEEAVRDCQETSHAVQIAPALRAPPVLKSWIITVLAVLFAGGAISSAALFLRKTDHANFFPLHTTATDSVRVHNQRVDVANPPSVIPGSDQDVLHLIPGGELSLPKSYGPEAGKRVSIAPFYMDETPVTNYQYVRFLKNNLSRVKVEDGVVKGDDGHIWLFLGEVKEGYEPIIFHKGKFKVKNAAHSACPVLRVTGYGAQAFVAHYGYRLPTEKEWLYLANRVDTTGGKNPPDIHSQMQHQSMSLTPSFNLPIPFPVIIARPDANGIRALNVGLGEWGAQSPDLLQGGNVSQTDLVILGERGENSPNADTSLSALPRYPWEAFGDVGFRCARDIANKGSSK